MSDTTRCDIDFKRGWVWTTLNVQSKSHGMRPVRIISLSLMVFISEEAKGFNLKIQVSREK